MSTTETKEKPPQVVTDAELVRQNELLKAQLKTREDQLRQAIDIANRANEVSKAREEAERQTLIDRVVIDTNGKYSKDELKDKPLKDLQIIKTALDKSLEQTFTNIAAYQAAEDQKKRGPQFTVGYWDSKKGNWVGGI